MREHTPIRSAAALALALLVAVTAAAPVAGAGPSAADRGASPANPLDLNTATVEALVTIPGIGEVMAQRIVDWREENGPFRSVDDLMKVKGVGEKTLEKLRPYVKVGKSH